MEINWVGFSPLSGHKSGVAIAAAVALHVPAGARAIVLQALTQNVRFTLDGSVPTATVGFQLKAADPPLSIHLGPGAILTVIEEAATASLQYQWGF